MSRLIFRLNYGLDPRCRDGILLLQKPLFLQNILDHGERIFAHDVFAPERYTRKHTSFSYFQHNQQTIREQMLPGRQCLTLSSRKERPCLSQLFKGCQGRLREWEPCGRPVCASTAPVRLVCEWSSVDFPSCFSLPFGG
jgi:hypothetical protein